MTYRTNVVVREMFARVLKQFAFALGLLYCALWWVNKKNALISKLVRMVARVFLRMTAVHVFVLCSDWFIGLFAFLMFSQLLIFFWSYDSPAVNHSCPRLHCNLIRKH